MSDRGVEHYLRLQLLLQESCKVLRKLLIHHAKKDTTTGVPYTTLDAYINSQEPTIDALVKIKVLHRHQYDILFTPGMPVTEEDMDITLVSCLLTNIVPAMSPNEEQWIQDIRDARNDLSHYNDITAINDTGFNTFWKKVEGASTNLSSTIYSIPNYAADTVKLIQELKLKLLPPPGPYMDIIKDLVRCNRDTELIKEAVKRNNSYMENLVHVRQNRNEPPSKRMRVLHPNLDKMQGTFKASLTLIRDGCTAPKEAESMKQKLAGSRRLFVTGPKSSDYLNSVLSVVKNLGFDTKRCVEMKSCADWRDVNKDDADLVLFRDPFGSEHASTERIDDSHRCFDDMLSEFRGQHINEKMYIVITSDYETYLEYLDICNREPHDILSECVVFQKPTTEEEPHIVTEDEKILTKFKASEENVLRNLQDQTTLYLNHFKERNITIPKLQEAKNILKRHKMLRIDGPRKSGRTSLAVKLMSDYKAEHCLLLQRPCIDHIHLGEISVVLIEDCLGKYGLDKQKALKWYTMFDVLLTAVTAGKLSVIVTTETKSFKACRLPPHDLLLYCVTLTSPPRAVIKQEPGQASTSEDPTDVVNEASSVYQPVRKSFLNATFERRREVNKSVSVYGCTFMPSGHLVLACDYKVVLMNTVITRKLSTLPVLAIYISTVSDTDVITTKGNGQYLQYISVSPPDMTLGEKIDAGDGVICKDVDVFNDEIYVVCEYQAAIEVRILNRAGTLLKTHTIDTLPEFFSYMDIALSLNGEHMYVSHDDKVTCVSRTQGQVIYQYKGPSSSYLKGMVADKEDNLLVCDYIKNNLHVIDRHGHTQRTLDKENYGITSPRSLCYRESDGCLVIGCHKGIMIFHIECNSYNKRSDPSSGIA